MAQRRGHLLTSAGRAACALRSALLLLGGLAFLGAGVGALVMPKEAARFVGSGPPDLYVLAAFAIVVGLTVSTGSILSAVRSIRSGAIRRTSAARRADRLRSRSRIEADRDRHLFYERPADLSRRGLQFWMGTVMFRSGEALLVLTIVTRAMIWILRVFDAPESSRTRLIELLEATYLPIPQDWSLLATLPFLLIMLVGWWNRRRACSVAGIDRFNGSRVQPTV